MFQQISIMLILYKRKLFKIYKIPMKIFNRQLKQYHYFKLKSFN